MEEPLDEDKLQELYTWIDEIPLSRPKRNITRDFSDGVLVAEIVAHFLPKMVELHNYASANSQAQKLVNWKTLNRKVLSKLSYTVPDNIVKDIVTCKPDVIEEILINLRGKIEKFMAKRKAESLRKNQQMYDEFTPDGLVSEHGNTYYDDGHNYSGPENNYGYAFNAGPPQDPARYPGPYNSHPPQPMDGSYYGQPQQMVRPQENGSPRGLNNRTRGKADPRAGNFAPHQDKAKGLQPKGKVARAQSYQDVNGAEQTNVRLALEEKEQALLASQETIQILQVKIRRLEHLLHLKDIRIDDLTKRLQQATQPPPRQLPPQQNPPQPPVFDSGSPRAIQMHHQQPLPPVAHPHYQQ